MEELIKEKNDLLKKLDELGKTILYYEETFKGIPWEVKIDSGELCWSGKRIIGRYEHGNELFHRLLSEAPMQIRVKLRPLLPELAIAVHNKIKEMNKTLEQ